MPAPTLGQIMDALAEQIRDGTAGTLLDDLQVDGRVNFNPTPPCIDIYPGDPFLEQQAFGAENRDLLFIVRARVSTADNEGGQELLLDMMDPRADSPLSVIQAIDSDPTLGGLVSETQTDGPSGFQVYADAGGAGSLLGCQWNARVLL